MFKNIVWDLLGKFGGVIVSFALSIILTRLLSPTEYGIMGMVMVVITFAHVFLDLGFNRAIIQRAEVSQIQYSTIFYINFGMALLLAIACFLSAGLLANFYKQPLIKPIFRVASISFVLNGLNLIPSSMLYKRMKFKVNSIQSLTAAVISGVIGVAMAYNGFGVWSLLIQSLVGSLFILLFNWFYIKWWPSMQFSMQSIKPMWAYGSRLFASGVLDTLYTRLDTFIIAKIFSPAILGYYARAQSMESMVRQFSAGSIISTLFPYIAKHQDDRNYLKNLFVKYLHIIMFVSVGISGCLFFIAKDIFTLLFTVRWEYAAELFQILAIGGFAWPVSSLMCSIISGVGNSKAFLKLEIIKRVMILPVYVFGFLLGLKGFIWIMLFVGVIGVVLNGVYTSREIAIDIRSQCRIMASYFLIGILSSLVTYYLCGAFPISLLLLRMSVYAATFSIFYVAGAFLFKLNGTEIINNILSKIRPSIS